MRWRSRTGPPSFPLVAYQRPLHYLLGVEGTALLRAYAGEHDRAFAEARVANIRRLLNDPVVTVDGVRAEPVDTVAGYQAWASTYDRPGNGLFAYEEPFVRAAVAELPAGRVLDAACGTGRHSAWLAARGHQVIGVDSSPDMLAGARVRVPAADLREGDLTALPVPDDHVDLVVCALALAHLPDLRPAFAELARVLRPGGHLVVTDVHQEWVALGSVPHVRSLTGEPRLIPSYRHRASDYLRAALPLGLTVRRCEEPRGRPADGDGGGDPAVGDWDAWPWSLLELVPEAARAAVADVPVAMLWHFRN